MATVLLRKEAMPLHRHSKIPLCGNPSIDRPRSPRLNDRKSYAEPFRSVTRPMGSLTSGITTAQLSVDTSYQSLE